jgi:hypothetical protein
MMLLAGSTIIGGIRAGGGLGADGGIALVLRESVQTASMYSWNRCDLFLPFFLQYGLFARAHTLYVLLVVGQHDLKILSTYTVICALFGCWPTRLEDFCIFFMTASEGSGYDRL